MKSGDLQNGYVKRGQRFFLLSFAVLILTGTLLLKIPGMYRPGPLSWLDALFTATSSVCVTGLTVKPISDFRFVGQLVVLLLIQVGGLGIMTLSASILLALGRGLSFSDSLMISNLNDKFSLRGTESLLRTVMIYTFSAEAAGFVAILPGVLMSKGISPLEGIWGSLFLSVSSFCNAGLTTFPDSLVGIHRAAQLPAALLAIIGGLGVYVIYDLLQAASCKSQRLRENSNAFLAIIGRLGVYVINDRLRVARRESHRLRVHSKLVLWTTGSLLVFGTAALWYFGWANDRPLELFDAFCFTVTSRTCGWITAPMEKLSYTSGTFIVVLMLIGGSPGSTAGGMKTTTIALLFANTIAVFGSRPNANFFGRRVEDCIVKNASTILFLYVSYAMSAAIVMTLIEGLPLQTCMFETFSAIGTVGLSLGVTPGLSVISHYILMSLMFFGRVGGLTIIFAAFSHKDKSTLRYPTENLIVG